MRQAVTIKDEKMAFAFSAYLRSQHIDHELERDGDNYDIWIVREEDVRETQKLYEQFKEDASLQQEFENKPLNFKSVQSEEKVTFPKDESAMEDEPSLGEDEDEFEGMEPPPEEEEEETEEEHSPYDTHNRAPIRYPWTKIFIVACVAVYGLTAWTSVQKALNNPNRIFPYWPPVVEALMYDFPKPFQMMVAFDKQYPLAQKTEMDTLDANALEQIAEIRSQPIWLGLYKAMLFPDQAKAIFSAPKFSSILHGQIYRAVTPIFLHGGILHILFNMLWLYLLGRALEPQMGSVRYVGFTLVSAVVANTFEYAMIGPVFLGYSGVLSAMVGYIWVRQKVAPYEWYPVDRSILLFFLAFIWGFFAIQIVLFALQYLRITQWDLGLGNAAHISGFLFGAIMAKTSLFCRR